MVLRRAVRCAGSGKRACSADAKCAMLSTLPQRMQRAACAGKRGKEAAA